MYRYYSTLYEKRGEFNVTDKNESNVLYLKKKLLLASIGYTILILIILVNENAAIENITITSES